MPVRAHVGVAVVQAHGYTHVWKLLLFLSLIGLELSQEIWLAA